MSTTPTPGERRKNTHRGANPTRRQRDRLEADQLKSRRQQAELAMAALPPGLSGLSLRVATAIIESFVVVEVPDGISRTAAAIAKARKGLTAAEVNRRGPVTHGVNCARAALSDAYVAARRPRKNPTA